MFHGTTTALITPFRDGRLDLQAMRELTEWQIASGIHGLVACGTTGEASSLTAEERLQVVRAVVEQTRNRIPVIAGTGTNNTRQSVELTERMRELKVDGVLVVTPYYVKPTQKGILDHVRAVAEVGLPVVVYNVPGRTGVSLAAETIPALCQIPNVVALKEATGDLKLDGYIVRANASRIAILSGDDFTYLPLLAIGGHGCISVVSNVAPREMAELYNRFKASDLGAAQALHLKLLPLAQALFTESSPIPVKAAAAMLGLCTGEVRLPLTELSESLRPQLRAALVELGLEGIK
jgi:4-hydroxy-tetrahydrodipicolinate synthase